MIYSVIHDYGRLITHEFPITDLQQISGPDGIGRINCTVSRGRDKFGNDRQFETVGVTQTRKGATITLIVNLMSVTIVLATGTCTVILMVNITCTSSFVQE